jgi:hypothetical protein
MKDESSLLASLNLYVLDEQHQPVKATSLAEWGRYMANEQGQRTVGYDEVGASTVSTVFLGIDHGFGLGPPRWFETMVFGHVGEPTWRYATWDEAREGHEAVVRRVRSMLA